MFNAELERQANVMAGLYADNLGLSEIEYINILPTEVAKPDSYKRKFDQTLLVQISTRELSLERMLGVLGIVSTLDLGGITNWGGKEGMPEPKTPYLTWVGCGEQLGGISPLEIRENLGLDERAGNIYDGLALYIQNLNNPDFLRKGPIALLGSSFGISDIPYLRYSDIVRRPVLSAYGLEVAMDTRFIVAGKEVITK